MTGKLYLIPAPLSDTNFNNILPQSTFDAIKTIKHFVVEDLRTARRYLAKLETAVPVAELNFSVLNEHTKPEEINQMLQPAENGFDTGLLSDAGMPCIADPGEDLVAIAQAKGIKVIPLTGPSSILLALTASGLNAERFSFEGYLPVSPPDLIKKIKQLEQISLKENRSVIFIETPYRNDKMMDILVNTCNPQTKICVACNLTADDEFVITKTAKIWKVKMPALHKKPTVFIIYTSF